jgi:Putative adhesin
MRNYVLAGFAVLALVELSLGEPTADTDRITRTERLAPGGTLRVKNFSGHVIVTGSDRGDVAIDAVRRGDREWLDRSRLDIYTTGSTLVVDANQTDRSWFDWTRKNRIVETDLDLKVPRKINVDVNVFSSPVTITGIEGSHSIHGFSSRVRLDDVTGSVRAHTFSGSVEIRAKTWLDNQSIDVDTFSGSIELHVPENARGSVTFNSFSGRLNSEMPLTLHSSNRRSLKAELGGGAGGTLRFKTFSGSVRIDR